MDNRRQDLLNQLEAAAAKRPFVPEDFLSTSFQIMYGLPTELQLRAAVHMCERYLPIFEKKWPGLTWCRQLLSDIDAWHRAEGEARPVVPDEADCAETAYYFGFTHLLCAYNYKDDPVVLTAGLCGTMLQVICARALNVWLADDAIAARIEQERDAYNRIEEEDQPPEPAYFYDVWKPEHNAYDNVAFDAVYRREWLHVAEWLRAEAVWKHPEPDDMEAMMRGLKRWEKHAFCPMGPEGAEPE
jgi:hypothetical protein